MINSCHVTFRSFQVVITQSNLYNLPTDIWNRHSDCNQFRLSFTDSRDHDSAWSSITTRNGIVIDLVYVRNLHWFCGLTAKPVADCKLLAFDQCVTMKSPYQDCMKEAKNDVCNIHDGKKTSVVGGEHKGFSSPKLDQFTDFIFQVVPTPSVPFVKVDVCRRHCLFPMVHSFHDDSCTL